MSSRSANAFVARDLLYKIALRVLLSLGFVAAGLWLIGAFGPLPPPDEGARQRLPEWSIVPIGWSCIVIFGAMAVGWTRRLIRPGETLIIDKEGIFLRHWSDATIPWADIASVSEDNMAGHRLLILTLHDPERYPGRGIAGLLRGINRKLIRGHMSYSLDHTDRSLDEALAAAAAFRPKARAAPLDSRL